jgi:hypothetical protein
VTSASSDVDFDDYGVFGYQLEPEYTEEELKQMEEAASAQPISRHNSSYMFKIEKCAQKQQIIIAWLGIGKLAEVMKTNLG